MRVIYSSKFNFKQILHKVYAIVFCNKYLIYNILIVFYIFGYKAFVDKLIVYLSYFASKNLVHLIFVVSGVLL